MPWTLHWVRDPSDDYDKWVQVDKRHFTFATYHDLVEDFMWGSGTALSALFDQSEDPTDASSGASDWMGETAAREIILPWAIEKGHIPPKPLWNFRRAVQVTVFRANCAQSCLGRKGNEV
jgi:hypothetical protein